MRCGPTAAEDAQPGPVELETRGGGVRDAATAGENGGFLDFPGHNR